jgi:hypothetical protein
MRHRALAVLSSLVVIGAGLGWFAGGAAASNTPGYKCPRGALCVYPRGDSWSSGPEKGGIYTTYGVHNLHGQYGIHLVYNNQYAVHGVAAGYSLCFGYNGTGTSDGSFTTKNPRINGVYITPVNSITLWLDTSGYARLKHCSE